MARKASTRLPEYVIPTAPMEEADLLGYLTYEHRELARLWTQLHIAHGQGADATNRGARYGPEGQYVLGRKIVEILRRHESREIEMLSAPVARIIGQEAADQARADHDEIKALLDEVDGEDPLNEHVFMAYEALMATVQAHMDEEELAIFPALRASLSADELAALDLPQPRAGHTPFEFAYDLEMDELPEGHARRELPVHEVHELPEAAEAADQDEVIDLAGAERALELERDEAGEADPTEHQARRHSLGERGRRLLRRL